MTCSVSQWVQFHCTNPPCGSLSNEQRAAGCLQCPDGAASCPFSIDGVFSSLGTLMHRRKLMELQPVGRSVGRSKQSGMMISNWLAAGCCWSTCLNDCSNYANSSKLPVRCAHNDKMPRREEEAKKRRVYEFQMLGWWHLSVQGIMVNYDSPRAQFELFLWLSFFYSTQR